MSKMKIFRRIKLLCMSLLVCSSVCAINTYKASAFLLNPREFERCIRDSGVLALSEVYNLREKIKRGMFSEEDKHWLASHRQIMRSILANMENMPIVDKDKSEDFFNTLLAWYFLEDLLFESFCIRDFCFFDLVMIDCEAANNIHVFSKIIKVIERKSHSCNSYYMSNLKSNLELFLEVCGILFPEKKLKGVQSGGQIAENSQNITVNSSGNQSYGNMQPVIVNSSGNQSYGNMLTMPVNSSGNQRYFVMPHISTMRNHSVVPDSTRNKPPKPPKNQD